MLSLRGAGKFQKEMGVVERQMKRIAHLVEELLDVSRMACGKITLEERELDVAALVATVTKKLRPLLESKAQHLYVQVERGLRVEGDAERLVQTFSNLLENAAKYTPAEGNIFLQAMQTEGQFQFSVRDTGVGIAPELLPRVFEPFFQERQLPDRSQGGLGLGLAIVQAIVDLHGGTVEAKSGGLGCGSEFIVRLPSRALAAVGALTARAAEMTDALPGTEAVTEQDSTAAPGPGVEAAHSKKILIVDDNVDAADMLGEALRYIGHEVVIAHDAPRALTTLERFKPAVALLDIGLPIMNGYELALRIRNTESLSAIRLIAVTGYGQPKDREQARAVGFEYHMVKPVDLSMLKRLIEGDGERDRDAAAHA
jgi:CheY-like chemotaxis protein/anti-sigma regulatory factor (Ser/Thr protein kinase)